MNRKKQGLGLCLGVLFMAASISGCAFGSYGKANVGSFDINIPSGLNGQNKSAIVKTLGVPDSNVMAGGTEYWRYRNKGGYFILLYGSTKEKDLVLEFKGDKVTSSYLVDKGSSVGIFAPQGAVSN